MPSPFSSLPQESRESDDDIFNPLKGKRCLQGTRTGVCAVAEQLPMSVLTHIYSANNLTVGKSWEVEFGVRPHALFGIIRSSGTIKNVEKVRIKGRKCLFAVLRSPGVDMRWGDIPGEWEVSKRTWWTLSNGFTALSEMQAQYILRQISF